MKKTTHFLLYASLLITLLGACSSRLTRIGDVRIYDDIPANWDDTSTDMIQLGDRQVKTFIANVEGEKVVFFLSNAKAMNRNMAQSKAKLQGAVNAAFALEGLTKSQIEWIEKRNADKEIIKEIKKVITTYLALDVNVSGLLTYKSLFKRYYEGNSSGFQVTLLMGMDYALFAQRRDAALKRFQEEKKYTPDKMKTIQLALAELDQN